MKELLMIFTHNPISDKIKNNFEKPIEEKVILENYLRLLNHTYSITHSLDKDKYIFYDRYIPFHKLPEDREYEKFIQLGSDKEEKMLNAFLKGFIKGYDSIVLIKTDSLDLTSEIIDEAFIKLQTHDSVLGATNEGNFYLVGLNKLNAGLFEYKFSNRKSEYEEALNQLTIDDATVFELPVLREANKEEDLSLLKIA